MKNKKPIKIFLVDDDALFLKGIEIQFKEHTTFDIKTFSESEECLNNLNQKPDFVFLDYNLNPSNSNDTGLIVLNKIKAIDENIQVVMLSSQDRIEVAVNCMKHDALDYIIKSEGAFIRAQKSITSFFNQKKINADLRFYKSVSMAFIVLTSVLTLSVILTKICYPNLLNTNALN